MARRKTIFTSDCYYHIYNRGSNKQNIFRDSDNYYFLLSRIKKYFIKFDIGVIAYCLMPNHYHFLLRQNGTSSISHFIQAVFNSHTKAFNTMYSLSETLFEGPFKSILIDCDEYLVHLCRYIHRNPLDIVPPLVKNIYDWPFSNYLDCIGKRNGILKDKNFINTYFPDTSDYEQFVSDYNPQKSIIKKIGKYNLD